MKVWFKEMSSTFTLVFQLKCESTAWKSCVCLSLLQCISTNCPECESVCVPWRGERAAGVGAAGCSLCPAAEDNPTGWAPVQGWYWEAVPGAKKMPGPHSSHRAHLDQPLSEAVGHAGEGKSDQLGRKIQTVYYICILFGFALIFPFCRVDNTTWINRVLPYLISLPTFWVAVQWSTKTSPYSDCYVCKYVVWPRN